MYVPAPVQPARHRQRDPREPDRLLRPRHRHGDDGQSPTSSSPTTRPARAGGAGLIVVQVAGVHETARYTCHVLMATDDACIPGYRALADGGQAARHRAVRPALPPRPRGHGSSDGTLPVAVAPSAVPNERFRVMPRPLRLADDRARSSTGYGAAARAAAARPASTASRSSPATATSRRSSSTRASTCATDEYGGSSGEPAAVPARGARRRSGGECGRRLRRSGVRISGDERATTGCPPTTRSPRCAALDAEGLAGLPERHRRDLRLAGRLDPHRPPMSEANGYAAPLAATVKAACRVPVFVAGRINQPQEAEHVLARRPGRRLRDDPGADLRPGHAQASRGGAAPTTSAPASAATRPASATSTSGYPISCIQHPETGRERVTASSRRRPRRRRSWSSAAARPA